ncbi:hypothetical protein OESDEN_03996 [Oesophagostomum dentatum]|uniref:Integrase catalytic domain-containing protein n=1 Tax=Oesophagostomum dentatum TaxID=61180 RepID=A0A0B1TFK9_OESDE|nr:hypothetical protein OESDEN_03996 [Oesophagostomum dentatum]
MLPSSTATPSKELKMLFGRFGNLSVIALDNGPQSKANEFQQFCKKQGIEHIHSPPFHLWSNDLDVENNSEH